MSLISGETRAPLQSNVHCCRALLDADFSQQVFLIMWSILLGSAAAEILPMQNPPFQCLLRIPYIVSPVALVAHFSEMIRTVIGKKIKNHHLLKFTVTHEKKKPTPCLNVDFITNLLVSSDSVGSESDEKQETPPHDLLWSAGSAAVSAQRAEQSASFIINGKLIELYQVKMSLLSARRSLTSLLNEPKVKLYDISPRWWCGQMKSDEFITTLLLLLSLFAPSSILSLHMRLCTDWTFSLFFLPPPFFHQPNQFHLVAVYLPCSFRSVSSPSLHLSPACWDYYLFCPCASLIFVSHLSGGPCCSLCALCPGFHWLQVLTICRPLL